jgi:hypothetical protein
MNSENVTGLLKQEPKSDKNDFMVIILGIDPWRKVKYFRVPVDVALIRHIHRDSIQQN